MTTQCFLLGFGTGLVFTAVLAIWNFVWAERLMHRADTPEEQ